MEKNYRILVDPSPLVFSVGYFNLVNTWISDADFDTIDEALDWIEWNKKIDEREKIVTQTSISGNEKFYFKH